LTVDPAENKNESSELSNSPIFNTLAAFGVPGIVFYILVLTSGVSGAAAYTSSLAFLGGPAGMLGGLFSMGVLFKLGPAYCQIRFSRFGISYEVEFCR
jgi:hypothetical protein